MPLVPRTLTHIQTPTHPRLNTHTHPRAQNTLFIMIPQHLSRILLRAVALGSRQPVSASAPIFQQRQWSAGPAGARAAAGRRCSSTVRIRIRASSDSSSTRTAAEEGWRVQRAAAAAHHFRVEAKPTRGVARRGAQHAHSEAGSTMACPSSSRRAHWQRSIIKPSSPSVSNSPFFLFPCPVARHGYNQCRGGPGSNRSLALPATRVGPPVRARAVAAGGLFRNHVTRHAGFVCGSVGRTARNTNGDLKLDLQGTQGTH